MSPHSKDFSPDETKALGELSPAESALIEWAETIDAILDGSLQGTGRVEFEGEVRRNDALREAFEEAKSSRALTSQLTPQACSPDFRAHLGDVLRATIDSESDPHVDSSTSRPLRSPAPRGRRDSLLQVGGLLAAVVALVAVLLPGRLLPPNESDPSSTTVAEYSDAEVRAALDEMRTALAMISGAMDGTAKVLRSEMHSEVSERLRAPLEEGLRRSVRSIPYLTPDSGNDQHSRNLSPPRTQSEVLEMVNALERTKT